MKLPLLSRRPSLRRLLGIAAAAAAVLACAGESAAAEKTEQLVVFLQPGAAGVDAVFEQKRLPEIRNLARQMGVAVLVRDVRRGAPEQVAVTPLLVYQNHRGRSIYQGRSTTLERIRNFIRTSRYVPQGEAPNRRRDIPVWPLGRARVWAPLKVSPVTGFPPRNYDHEAFLQEALAGIREGFEHFRFRDRVDLGRADRGFYMDFYPWRSRDGSLFLSLALYSQFHCKAPIFEKKKAPLTGPWQDRKALFRKAARILEAEVARHIRDPESGDSFTPVPEDTLRVSWPSIALALPPAPPRSRTAAAVDLTLPNDWILEPAGPDDPPMLLFRFPAPLDQYAGEITAAAGELHLTEGPGLSGAKGYVEVDTRSAVTMGNAVLDEAIRGAVMLNARKHPTARFTIDAIDNDGPPLAYGRLTPAGIRGQFTLKDTTIALSAAGEFEPVVGPDGRPRLLVRGRFQIDLRDFDIEGADGPAPARHILIFDIHLTYGKMAAATAEIP